MKKELSYLETIKAIDEVKKYFERQLEARLSLTKVQCPLFVKSDSGLQDALTGVEKGVSFTKGKEKFEIVHSLAKWKRYSLGKDEFPLYEGILTDMKAIRRDEKVDCIHEYDDDGKFKRSVMIYGDNSKLEFIYDENGKPRIKK